MRMSIPAVAKSGTELTFIPPENVPTLSVGCPSSSCDAGGSSKPLEPTTARASL